MSGERLLPPDDPVAFESLCLDVWREIWSDPGAQKNGRSGQPQAGVDVFGRTAEGWVGVQCKKKDDLLRTKLSVRELEDEVRKAKTFQPPLQRFLVATTGPRDATVQERARELSEPGFSVEVWSWPDIWHEISQRKELFARIYPVYWPLQAGVPERRVAPTRLTHAADRLFGRKRELAALDDAWTDPTTHVVTLVAWGGVGKTSLVAKWVADLAARDHDGADYFDWSFYSQGTREEGGASADPFVDKALRFFGDAATADSAQSPWDKGSRLAQLVAERRTLLVLDGLEPLQLPPGPLAGELKDPAMTALLKGLAARNPGLCVVTTRERVENLIAFEGSTAPKWELEHLSTTAGVELLTSVGVHGAAADLKTLVEEVHGHALTLTLLSTFLRDAHDGDVRAWKDLSLLEVDDLIENVQASRVMESYSSWFGTGPEAQILAVLGLFDRPAAAGLLEALRKEPAIRGATDELVGLSAVQWKLAVSKLRKARLLLKVDGAATHNRQDLDAHPLVREHFGRRLQQQNPAAWKEAHSRLFDHLSESAEPGPETLAGLQPLYQAILHGCRAGRQAEAFQKVYLNRIQGWDAFPWKKLGAMSADLGAVRCFFDQSWTYDSASLPPKDRGYLLNQAAICLQALGRLTEAFDPLRKALRISEKEGEPRDAAASAVNLSQLSLFVGDLASGADFAVKAVDLAAESSDPQMQITARASLGTALCNLGRREEGLGQFGKAEVLQSELNPNYPSLVSVSGFRYCEALLGDVEQAAHRGGLSPVPLICSELKQRAAGSLALASQEELLLDVALGHLMLGRISLCEAILGGSALGEASIEIEQAVNGLHAAGQLEYLPLGLLTRCWLRSAQGDAEGARADLAAAQEIAERGPMPLFLADVHLYRARFFHDRDALAEARRLVDEHGYGRRLGELEDLEAVVDSW